MTRKSGLSSAWLVWLSQGESIFLKQAFLFRVGFGPPLVIGQVAGLLIESTPYSVDQVES
jgi:hypothetical protein